jgi:SAM-dependent methyltransferase
VQVTPSSGDVYYADRYWNELEPVQRYLDLLATGDANVRWWQHLAAWRGRPFRKALSINCGNGWVERQLLEYGVIESAVGIDFTESFLTQARDAAAAASLPIEYLQADINTFDFDVEGVDLVINHAAGHHIAYIDRAFRHLARVLGSDGVFASYDYVGAHRNHYPTRQWDAVHQANERLPEHLRQNLRYANMAEMLRLDPTEAIHSELIMPTMRRYFDLAHEAYLGGGVAYEILSRNPPFHDPQGETSTAVDELLTADLAYRDIDPEAHSLFAYVIAIPKADTPSAERMARWEAEEHDREAAASQANGRYYPPTLIESLSQQIYTLEGELHLSQQFPPSAAARARRRLARLRAIAQERRR